MPSPQQGLVAAAARTSRPSARSAARHDPGEPATATFDRTKSRLRVNFGKQPWRVITLNCTFRSAHQPGAVSPVRARMALCERPRFLEFSDSQRLHDAPTKILAGALSTVSLPGPTPRPCPVPPIFHEKQCGGCADRPRAGTRGSQFQAGPRRLGEVTKPQDDAHLGRAEFPSVQSPLLVATFGRVAEEERTGGVERTKAASKRAWWQRAAW